MNKQTQTRASDSATTIDHNEPTIEDQADSSMSREVELYRLLRAEGWSETAAEREAERMMEFEAKRIALLEERRDDENISKAEALELAMIETRYAGAVA